MPGARLPLRASPPRVGEHTRALLAEAGLDEAASEALIARGATATPWLAPHAPGAQEQRQPRTDPAAPVLRG
ncbi:MAG: hypothetical protein ACK5WG_17310 [Betaproteobacteria bacterium]